MNTKSRLCVAVLIAALISPLGVAAQSSPDAWRTFAEKVDLGTELQVRLQDGKRFRATLVGVDDTTILLQPKTRVPVPVQSVPLDSILSLERAKAGMGAGKAAAIGIGTGVGAFWGMLALLFAIYGD
jgi:hypothetical protein